MAEGSLTAQARMPKIDHAIVPRHIDLRAIVLRCNAQAERL